MHIAETKRNNVLCITTDHLDMNTYITLITCAKMRKEKGANANCLRDNQENIRVRVRIDPFALMHQPN